MRRRILAATIIALMCTGLQTPVFADVLQVRFPIMTRQPAINNHVINYHIYTDYNSRGVSNWRHIPPHNLMVYGD